MIVVFYIISLYSQLDRNELIKMDIIVSRTLKYLIYSARQFILSYYYWKMNAMEDLPRRKKSYIFKKHFKVTTSTYEFKIILNLRNNSNRDFLPDFPGHSHIKNKLYKYYDNLEIIKKINYLDNISMFDSDKSIGESTS